MTKHTAAPESGQSITLRTDRYRFEHVKASKVLTLNDSEGRRFFLAFEAEQVVPGGKAGFEVERVALGGFILSRTDAANLALAITRELGNSDGPAPHPMIEQGPREPSPAPKMAVARRKSPQPA